MPRRHPARSVFLYGVPNAWWRAFELELSNALSLLNEKRIGVAQEHWFAKPSPSPVALRRRLRGVPAVICVAREQWSPEFEKAVSDKPSPVHVIADTIDQRTRLRAESLGWRVWVSRQIEPSQLVEAIVDYIS